MDITTRPPVVLIHEFFSGGGSAGDRRTEDLTTEGLAMLQAILADFRAWGGVRTLTTLDARLAHLQLPADEVVLIESRSYPHALEALLTRCSSALFIAPETDGLLYQLTASAERAGVVPLGSSATAIAAAANKWKSYLRCSAAGLPAPKTWRVSPSRATQVAQAVGFPLVMKPLFGAGCTGVWLLNSLSDLHAALQHQQQEDLILQRYVHGTHASVSVLVARHGSLPLSLNMQHIRVYGKFIYAGATVPLRHPRAEEAISLASRAVSLVPGLGGYVGIDLIVGEKGCYLIEINPRLTTSYTALRRVIRCNMAEAIWRACHEDRLPENASLAGEVTVRKEDLNGYSAS